MKKLVIGMVIVLFVAAIFVLGFKQLSSKNDLYSVYERATVQTIDVNSQDPIVYYFYQPTCEYCNANKGNVTQFAKDIKDSKIKFEVVDLTDPANLTLWYESTGQFSNPVLEDPNFKSEFEIQDISDLKITGTPSAIYVNEGEVQNFGVASTIYDVFTKAATDFNVPTTFSSEYLR